MLHTTRAIVLRTFRHGDRTVVLKALTEGFGMRAYMVRAGGKGGAAAAALQPLSRLEMVVTEHVEREMHSVRELRVQRPYTQLHTDPVRGTLALFVQEVLYRTLREGSADEALFAYVEEALEAMDTATDIRCFPLMFLLGLSAHLGFRPEGPGPGEDRFDLKEGHFTRDRAAHDHTIGQPLSGHLAALLQADLGSMGRLEVPAAHRRELLDHLLLYYRLHTATSGELRSPGVLHQVLG